MSGRSYQRTSSCPSTSTTNPTSTSPSYSQPMGNSARQSSVSGDGVSGEQEHAESGSSFSPVCDGESMSDPELSAYLNHGLFGPNSMQPPTNIGGFQASMDPRSGRLHIRIQGSIGFIDGLSFDGTTFTENHADLAGAATYGNGLGTQELKNQFHADFVWGAEKQEWLATMVSNVMNTWDQGFTFWVDRPQWECVFSWVDLDVDIADSTTRSGDHLNVSAYKCPDDGSFDVGAEVNSWSNDPDATTMTLSSRDAQTSEERTADGDSLLQRSVGPFDLNSSDLPAGGSSTLDAFAADFIDANLDRTNPINLVGRSSSDGSASYNERLAERRAQSVSNYLRGKGVSNLRISTEAAGETGADQSAIWRRVDLVIGDGRAQDVAAHEFGHVLGLTDHYDNAGTDANGDGIADRGGIINGTGQPAGTLAGHDNLAKAIGVSGGAVHENNDNIMSLGTNVSQANYATIGWALQNLTNIPDWKIS